MAGLPEGARAAIAMAEERLRPFGWVVETAVVPPNVRIEVAHELSSPHGFNFLQNSREAVSFIERCLQLREFRIIADRPANITHGALLGRFRQVADANRWHDGVLAVVAQVLEAQGVISEAESLWLEEAGPAWAAD
jgi:hypothetical protein